MSWSGTDFLEVQATVDEVTSGSKLCTSCDEGGGGGVPIRTQRSCDPGSISHDAGVDHMMLV